MSFPRKKFFEGITYHEADWDELQNNIGNYYDNLINLLAGRVAVIEGDYLTSAHRTEGDPHPLISIDYILQGTSFHKFSAAEYAKFLTGFYDILDSGSTVKLGHNRDITGFYFAKGDDADGANIYANDLFSRGYPVHVLVFQSAWLLVPSKSDSGNIAHGLGYRPSYASLQLALADPTGNPEEYIFFPNYGIVTPPNTAATYAQWNNTYYKVTNNTTGDLYVSVLFFSYLGA